MMKNYLMGRMLPFGNAFSFLGNDYFIIRTEYNNNEFHLFMRIYCNVLKYNGTLKTMNFPFVPNGKLMGFFWCSNI